MRCRVVQIAFEIGVSGAYVPAVDSVVFSHEGLGRGGGVEKVPCFSWSRFLHAFSSIRPGPHVEKKSALRLSCAGTRLGLGDSGASGTTVEFFNCITPSMRWCASDEHVEYDAPLSFRGSTVPWIRNGVHGQPKHYCVRP